MSSKIFKVSVVAATVAASFSASAALYNVYMYEPVDSSSQTFGSGIQQSTEDCWVGTDCSATHATNHKIAYEEQRFPQGFEYRDESPFLMEYGYDFLDEGRSGFESYCNRYLDYSNTLCDNWASQQYTLGYVNEVTGDYQNSTAYVETVQETISSNNTVINAFNESGDVIGSYQVDDKERTRGFAGGTAFTADGDRTQAFAQLGTLTVGSVSTQSTNHTNDYTSKAAVWDGTTLHQISWVGGAKEDSRSMPQGSARDIAEINGTQYAVGYNANGDEIPVAAVFNLSDLNSISTSLVFKYTDDDKFLNSLLTSVNDNGIAIGTAKYRVPNGKAYSNSLFYVSDVTSASPASKSFSGEIFFSSANGKAGAINNNNVVVGQIDFEQHSESNGGKPRAKRAFVAPIEGSPNSSIFKNRAWYLDDLTYGIEANNAYRIVDATDINDAGVISGTAYYCAGGFESTEIDASCSASASKVAVKLVPVQGATANDISSRPVKEVDIDRSGSSFGIWALTLLALIGFRRK